MFQMKAQVKYLEEKSEMEINTVPDGFQCNGYKDTH